MVVLSLSLVHKQVVHNVHLKQFVLYVLQLITLYRMVVMDVNVTLPITLCHLVKVVYVRVVCTWMTARLLQFVKTTRHVLQQEADVILVQVVYVHNVILKTTSFYNHRYANAQPDITTMAIHVYLAIQPMLSHVHNVHRHHYAYHVLLTLPLSMAIANVYLCTINMMYRLV